MELCRSADKNKDIMEKKRKRINISLDAETYDGLQHMCKVYGIKGCPTLLVAFAHIVLDRLNTADKRRYVLEDADYIDNVFDELAHIQREPDGTVPVKGYAVHIDSEVWQKTKNTED